MSFVLIHTDASSKARAGVLETGHGKVLTPVFMPVGTSGTVKAVHQHELCDDIGAQVILGNTYHLYLRPGTEIIGEAGGLHRFMNWSRPILTDSGGYQVFSLASQCKVKEEGAVFRSHIDGSKHVFSPEKVVDIQRVLGSDIVMALDVCPPYPETGKRAYKAVLTTTQWLARGFEHFTQTRALYGYPQIFVPIAQGSVFDDLRIESCHAAAQIPTSVCAVGGLSVGEPKDELYRMTDLCSLHLPADRARYLMGVGTPENILECIGLGMDMFDCVLPTRNARHGIIYTTQGIVHIKNAKWKGDFGPIDSEVGNRTSANHSKAYLRHLFSVNELLAAQLASIQNLSFYTWLVAEARRQILANNFVSWKREILQKINCKL